MDFPFKKIDFMTAEIVDFFHGSKQHSMPIVKDMVHYCKFRPELNNLPSEVWIEEGPLLKKACEILIGKKDRTPVFVKKVDSDYWRYIGMVKFCDVSTNQTLNHLNKNPPRKKIQKILKLDIDE